MKFSVMGHLDAWTSNWIISCRHLEDYVKKLHQKVCRMITELSMKQSLFWFVIWAPAAIDIAIC